MTMRALVSADRPAVGFWHPKNPKLYVEIRVQSQRLEHSGRAIERDVEVRWTGFEVGEDAPSSL